MAVYKDNATGTWRVIYRFTNWKGGNRHKREDLQPKEKRRRGNMK